MKNNNKEVIKLLADNSYKYNKTRNYVLIGAIIFTVMTILCIFSLTKGKIEANRLLYIRNVGTSAFTTLERATETQYDRIKELPYVRQIGKFIKIGSSENFDCVVLDHTAWEDIQKPAYTDIYGTYPQKNDEIMLSIRSLNALGIVNPKVGMPISIEMKTLNNVDVTKEFILSGYYTEYVGDMIGLPNGYFSREILNDYEIKETTLLIKQKDSISREDIEKMLYRDVKMVDDTQQFIGGNSITSEQIYKLVGGYDIAVTLIVLILVASFLLIYNILSISSSKDIRQYGLLKVLGTTKKQLKKVLMRQAIKMTVIGCSIGAISGSVISIFIIPDIVSKMYLTGYGDMDHYSLFSPFIVIFSIIFCIIIVYLGVVNVVRKITKTAPVKTINAFEENKYYNSKKSNCSFMKHTYSISLISMAWRNIMKRRGQFFIIVLSVTLGLIIALSSQIILKGTDTTNEINYKNHDFKIMTNMTANMISEYKEGEIFWDYELENQIRELSDIEYFNITSGGYGMLTNQNDALNFYNENKGSDNFVVQILNKQDIEDFEQYIKDKNLKVDMNELKDGNGIILLHYHSLSKIQEDQAIQNIGKPVTISNMDGMSTAQMSFAGAVDCTLSDFPDLKTTWNSNNIVYFLVTEAGFKKMNLTKQIFRMDLDVNPKSEPLMKQDLERIIAQYNKKYIRETQTPFGVTINDLRTLSITNKSDLLENEKNSIESNMIIMTSFCFIIILMGLVNYTNSMITGLTIRKKEFAVMNSIGLTKKQLRQMLIFEGCFYSLTIVLLTICFGNIIWYFLAQIMKHRIKYFQFYYPFLPLMISSIILFIICVMIPLIIERKDNKENLTDKLKLYTD